MRKWYSTFSGAAYNSTTKLIAERATTMGADQLLVFDDLWLTSHEFYKLNHWAWDHPGDAQGRKWGYGWYAWKPLVIIESLKRMQDSDILIFTDADCFPIADFSCLYDYCARNGGFFLFEEHGCSNRQWVKRDAWILTGAEHFGIPVDSPHATARFIVFQKGHWRVEQFLMEWLTYSVNPLVMTYDPSVLASEHEGFTEARNEQAVFTLLAHRYGIPLHRTADAWGRSDTKDWELYGELFEQRYCEGDRNDLSGSAYRNV